METSIVLDQSAKWKLRCSELLSALSDSEFERLIGSGQLIACSFGDCITANTGLDFLVSGKVRLVEKNDTKEETVCTFEHAGDFWGPPLYAGDEKLEARAAKDSLLVRINEKTISQLASGNSQFAAVLRKSSAVWGWYRTLAHTALFREMGVWKARSLLRYFEPMKLDAGPVNSGLRGLAIVLKGHVQLSEPAETLAPGDYFVAGEMKFVQATRGGIIAQESCDVIVLSPSRFNELLQYGAELASMLALSLSKPSRDSAAAAPKVATVTVSTPPPPEELHRVETGIRKTFHRYPFIQQQSQMDCGITCIAMIALFFGKRLSLNELRERAGVGIEGTSLLALAETAEQCGFLTRGIRATYAALLNAKLPLICFWKNNHFVVLFEINEKFALVGDPAEGIVKIPRADFTRDFSKSALEMVPTVDLKLAKDSKSPFSMLLPLLRPHTPQIRDVVIAAVIFQLLMLITPFFSQAIMDKVLTHEDISMLNMLLVGMLLLTCFQSSISFMRGLILAAMSAKLDQALFTQFFSHLLSLPLKFFEQRTTGDIIARFNENGRITSFLSGQNVTVFLDGILTLIYLGVIFWYDLSFGLVTVAYAATLAVVTMVCTPILLNYNRELFKKTVACDSYLIETMRGVEKVKSAAAEHRTRWKWEVLFMDKLSVAFREQLAINGYNVLTQLVHLAGNITLLWLGAHLVIAHKLTIGQYVAVNMMAGMVISPLMRIVSMWNQLQRVQIAFERLGDVFEAQPEQVNQRARLSHINGEIVFENVTFRYGENANKNVLLNISFEAKPNQLIAIVGRSGCGKTTTARLIQGLYQPTAGRVLIDGVDTTQVELSDLRKRIGIVAQQEFFFSGSVRENLSFYWPEAPLEKVVEAARIAGIDERINAMASGYDTLLSEGGANLSGGERQRLAIARAILHDPKILIFDEATSALDSESERRIQASMDAIRQERTMIVIAHRLATIKSADLILVMEEGQIVERGTHDQLLSMRGLYFQLCNQQSI